MIKVSHTCTILKWTEWKLWRLISASYISLPFILWIYQSLPKKLHYYWRLVLLWIFEFLVHFAHKIHKHCYPAIYNKCTAVHDVRLLSCKLNVYQQIKLLLSFILNSELSLNYLFRNLWSFFFWRYLTHFFSFV